MNNSELEAASRVLAELVSRSEVRRRIVALVAAGESRKGVARALDRSLHTVDAHLKDIYRRTGLRDRVLLAMLRSGSPPGVGGLMPSE